MGNKISTRFTKPRTTLKSGVGWVSSWTSFHRSSRSVSNRPRLISHPINATRDLIARRYIIYTSRANWSATRMPVLPLSLHRLRLCSISLLKPGDFNAWTYRFRTCRVFPMLSNKPLSRQTPIPFLRLRPFSANNEAIIAARIADLINSVSNSSSERVYTSVYFLYIHFVAIKL